MKDKSNLIERIIQSIMVIFIFFYGKYFRLIPVVMFNMDLKKLSINDEILLTLFSNIVILILLILIYRKDLIKEWKIFKSKFLDNIDIGFKYWFLGLAGMVASNLILNVFLKAGGAANEKAIQEMISAIPLLMLVNAGIMAPLIEEMVFRKAFKKVLSKKWIFVLISGIVFGALHVITSFNNPLELLYIIPYSCLGISFAYMYYKSDTVFTPISMHMIHNFVLTLISIIAR